MTPSRTSLFLIKILFFNIVEQTFNKFKAVFTCNNTDTLKISFFDAWYKIVKFKDKKHKCSRNLLRIL